MASASELLRINPTLANDIMSNIEISRGNEPGCEVWRVTFPRPDDGFLRLLAPKIFKALITINLLQTDVKCIRVTNGKPDKDAIFTGAYIGDKRTLVKVNICSGRNIGFDELQRFINKKIVRK